MSMDVVWCVVMIAGLVAFDLAALRFGVDSRFETALNPRAQQRRDI